MQSFKKSLFEPFMVSFVTIVIYTVRGFMLLWYRPKITFTSEKVQSTKLKNPAIIIANHSSMLDPILMLALFFHKRSIVVAKDQINDPHFSWALTRADCVIPCDRFNLDTEWALIAKKELEKGNSVIIFPEGKCRYDGLLNEFKTGFAFLSRSSKVPVLPVGIDGIYKLGHRTHIVVGEPEKIERKKNISSSEQLKERSQYFRQIVWKLKQQALGIEGESL